MYHNNILRETKSICPVCLEFINAFIVERDGKVFFSKACPLHGQFEILLSKNAHFYRGLDNYYFAVMDEEKKILKYEIWPTIKCDIDCTICHLGKAKQEMGPLEPSCEEIENFIKKSDVRFYILSGGESTCRDDLIKIIQIFKKHHKVLTMHTNGMKIVDKRYLRELKRSGLDRVNLQFDGFDRQAYKIFRGTDLLETKLTALKNLRDLNMPTDLNVTIAKNVNENNVDRIIDFAAKNYFINGVNFFTICLLGGVRDWNLDNYIMPDEVVDILEKKTNHIIIRRNVFLFQKLHFAIKSWQKQRSCLYSQIYILVRNRNSYEPIDKYLNLERTEKWLDRYQRIYKQNKLLAKLLLMIVLPISLFRWSSFKLAKEIIMIGLSYFLQTSHYLKSRRFLFISFTTGCDPYKIDYSLIKNCQDEIIHLDINTGKLEDKGCDGLHCINMERRYLLSQKSNCVSV